MPYFAVTIPWVPEVCLARFPVSECLYCDPREKPLEKSAVSLIAPSQWETCLNQFITYRAKLLNADWFRQRAFFLNFPSMEGKIT